MSLLSFHVSKAKFMTTDGPLTVYLAKEASGIWHLASDGPLNAYLAKEASGRTSHVGFSGLTVRLVQSFHVKRTSRELLCT